MTFLNSLFYQPSTISVRSDTVWNTNGLSPSRLYGTCLHHQHDSFLWRSGTMQKTFGNGYTLIGIQFDCLVFKVNLQLSFEHKEEFIVMIVLVPMIFAFYNSNSNNAVIHFCQRLIEPFVLAFFHNARDINQRKVLKLDIKIGHIGELLGHEYLLSVWYSGSQTTSLIVLRLRRHNDPFDTRFG